MVEFKAPLDADVMRRAAKVFKDAGLSMSEGVQLLLRQVADNGRVSLSFHQPNAETREAILELERGEGLSRTTLNELAEDWRGG